MNVRRLAFVIPSLGSGGAERVVTTLANELVKTYSVTIVTYAKEKSYYRLADKIKLEYCLEKFQPSQNFGDSLRLNSRLLRGLIRIIKENEIELVIGFLTSANVLSILASKICRTKCIVSERNNPEKDSTTKFWAILRRYTYPLANQVIVQTQLIKMLISNYVNPKKITIIPNPLNPELSLKRNVNSFRSKSILSVGRLTNQKNQEMLIEAFYMTGVKDWELIIVGEGERRSNYEILIKDLNIQNLVKLPGRDKEIANYYNKASIFAFSSNYEGFPNALLEALHFGLACISTDCPTGPSELINDGVNGLLVNVQDKIAMSEGLVRLINDEKLRDKFRFHGMESVKKYELSSVILKWKNLIDNNLN